jgi:hypothetical protein
MGDNLDLTIGDKLIESCTSLYNDGILSQPQYKKCITSMGSSDTYKQIKITEKNVFGDLRENKEVKYRNFLKSVKSVLDETLDKINTTPPPAGDILIKYNEVLMQLVMLMNNVTMWIQKIALKRNNNNETRHYDQLLYYYNRIDNNRKELESIEKQYKTLEENNNNMTDKHDVNYFKYKTQLNITIALSIFIIITLVIIFLLYFI